MSKAAICGLITKGYPMKLHDSCPNNKCSCQKIFSFTRRHFQMEGAGFKSKLQNFLKGTKAALDKFLKPAVNEADPFIGMAVSAKPKTPKFGQATTTLLKSESGGEFSSLTDIYGNGLRLKIM